MPLSISPPCFHGLEIGNLLAGEARKTREEVETPQLMCRLHLLLLGPVAPQSPSPTEAEMSYTAPWDRSRTGALVIANILRWQAGKCQLGTQISASA